MNMKLSRHFSWSTSFSSAFLFHFPLIIHCIYVAVVDSCQPVCLSLVHLLSTTSWIQNSIRLVLHVLLSLCKQWHFFFPAVFCPSHVHPKNVLVFIHPNNKRHSHSAVSKITGETLVYLETNIYAILLPILLSHLYV